MEGQDPELVAKTQKASQIYLQPFSRRIIGKEIKAAKNEPVLKKLIETDEGAARLGEIALVPHGSPISQCGNSSLMHVDFMIGSERMDVDAIRGDGGVEALMRAGEWVAWRARLIRTYLGDLFRTSS